MPRNSCAKKWLANYGYIPDAIVVEGPKAGGHLGYKADQIEDEHYSLEEILPPIVEEVHAFEAAHDCHIPVIAGGGVYTGEDIYNILQLGAEGVQMGTRFVATEECDADPAFKESYVHARKEDIEIIQSPVGMPGRAIHSSFLEKVKAGLKRPKSLSVQLYQDLRRFALALLHHAGALQRLSRQVGERLRLLRCERLADGEDSERARTDRFAAERVREFFTARPTLPE